MVFGDRYPSVWLRHCLLRCRVSQMSSRSAAISDARADRRTDTRRLGGFRLLHDRRRSYEKTLSGYNYHPGARFTTERPARSDTGVHSAMKASSPNQASLDREALERAC